MQTRVPRASHLPECMSGENKNVSVGRTNGFHPTAKAVGLPACFDKKLILYAQQSLKQIANEKPDIKLIEEKRP